MSATASAPPARTLGQIDSCVLLDQPARVRDHVVDAETKRAQLLLQRSRSAEGAPADGGPAQADMAHPAKARRLLNRQATMDVTQQHHLAAFARLLLEQFSRRQAHHTSRDALGLQALRGTCRQCQLAARGEQDQR